MHYYFSLPLLSKGFSMSKECLMGMFHPSHLSAEKEKRFKSQSKSNNKLIIVMVTHDDYDDINDDDEVGTDVASFS
jgi:hypothetical protein